MGAEGLPGLSPAGREAITAATFLAGGRRHLALVGSTAAETFAIADNIPALVDRLRARGPGERCVVLASGDPLCFGIGQRLGEALGRADIRVEPAVSSLQLAFARAGVPWQDAAIASIHGRPLAATLLPLLGRPRIGLFTHDGASPAAVASFFLDRGLDDYRAWVGERLGSADERVFAGPIAELTGRTFDPLNFLVLERPAPTFTLGSMPRLASSGLPDELFARPDAGPVLLTHADVRAVVVARFHGVPAGPIWDVGAGLGGVAIELARALPAAEVYAFERDAGRLDLIRRNRARFGAWNVTVVPGEAPGCLAGAPDPAGVFLGGTGGRLDPILDAALARLRPGGVLVGDFVGLENLGRCLERLKGASWPVRVSQVQLAHGRDLAGLTVLTPERPVWVVRAIRPGGGEASE